MNNLWFGFGVVLALVAATSPAWVVVFKNRKLLNDALNPVKIRSRHIDHRAAEARKEAKKIKKELLRVAERLVEYGNADTETKYVATWYQKRQYEVTEATIAYTKRWSIKVPVVTDKEISDLIVK